MERTAASARTGIVRWGLLAACATAAACVLAGAPAATARPDVRKATAAAAATCPCSVFGAADTPGADANDPGAVEVGMKFRADTAGFVTGVRFYKHAGNTGVHTGSLWATDGTRLATVTFSGETASGWQEASFGAPVAVTAGTTYVVSYHAPAGHYAASGGYFNGRSVDNGPLQGLADGTDGPNGVYRYGPGGSYPTDTFNSANYWVDIVFATSVGPDTTAPLVSAISPADGANAVASGGNVTATFDEALAAGTVSGSTFELRGPGNVLVPAAVSYDAAARRATLDPSSALADSTTYTARVTTGVTDAAGNALAAARTWSFTTAAPPPPPPNEGPGGPVLVIGTATNPFSRYTAEILRNEGLNAFTVSDISLVTPATLSGYDVAILGEMTLGAAQVSMLTSWVNGGGNLIALRPDAQLAGLLGLTPAGAPLTNGYLRVDTAAAPGTGIVGETIQYHGTADSYTLNGAAAVATLYASATAATVNPAVTLRSVGSNGGQAAAFTYDLARSVVLTRQGNPAWAGQERDGVAGLRSSDLFFPDWVNLDKVAIPQADEQQRLLANLIELMNRDRKPLPRFWYFPRGEKAVVVMTGDDHASGGTAARFAQQSALGPAGCSVASWECVRSTSYIYPGTPLSDAQAAAFEAQGFEVALHPQTGCQSAWTPASLEADFASQLAQFSTQLPSVPAPTTNRTHCITWADWVTHARVELAHGIRLDTNYYYFPPAWMADKPGMFTGSGMPMRFAAEDGSIVDVYQATTQMTDESGQAYPFTGDALLDKAVGPEGYYGAFTANMHTDAASSSGSDAIIASALARGVPVVTARQLLTWLDGRNASSFESLSWAGNTLSFSIAVGAGANGLQAMVPTASAAGPLTGITRGGSPVATTTQTIKGVEYALLAAAPGAYQATYAVDTSGPVLGDIAAVAGDDGTAQVTWTTNEASTSRVEFGTAAGNLNQTATTPGLATAHAVALAGLAPSTTYHYRVVSADAAGNDTSSTTRTFATPSLTLRDTTAGEFGQGATGAGTHVAEAAGGEVILAPASAEEFGGAALPAGWTPFAWNPGGTAAVAGGALALDGARAGPDATFGPGRSLEFVATFNGAAFQHMGFGVDYNDGPWAMFSTQGGGNVVARTNTGSGSVDTPVGAGFLGAPHRFRIDWNAAGVVYSIDGTVVATHALAFAPGTELRPLASDYNLGGGGIAIDWSRVTPYAGAGSFVSRVLDAGAAANWGALAYTASAPAGTSVALSVRTGDTAAPDASWTAFEPVAQGGQVGGNSRYAQYRADLATSNPGVTPELRDVAIGLQAGPDTTAPAIVDRIPASGATGVATGTDVTARFSESMSAASLTAASFRLRAQGASADVAAAVSAAGAVATLDPSVSLQANRLYTVTVAGTVADRSGNTLGSAATWTFRTAAATTSLGDTTDADFGAGSTADCTVGGGQLTLAPALAEGFAGTALPVGWSTSAWAAGGAVAVAGGSASADGALLQTDALYGPGRSLEFVATFGATSFQHAGYAGGPETYNGPPWAMFSTGASGSGMLARTSDGATPIDTPVAVSLLGTPHRYRIDWNAASVDFYVDGAQVASHAVALAGPMRFAASDLNVGGAGVAVDSVQLSPYTSPCTFVSRVFDTSTLAAARSIAWIGDTPAGTSLALSVRTGTTAAPDAGWTDWTPLAASPAALPAGRYAQYRAVLAATNPAVTPALQEVTLSGELSSNEPPVAVDDAASTSTGSPVDVSVLVNDTDPDGDTLGVSAVTQGAHGAVAIVGTSVRYSPAAGYAGPDAFTYTAADGNGGTATAAVNVTVVQPNRPPVAVDDTASTTTGTPVTVAVLANDTDADADTLSVSAVTQGAHGAVTVVGTSVRYTPAAGYVGPDSFTYTASDGRGGTATATVQITVAAVNRNPVAVADARTVAEDGTLSFLASQLKTNDTDPDGDALTVTAVAANASTHGTVTLVAGTVTYKPAANYNGAASFAYTVSDGRGGVATGPVNVTVTAVADAPALQLSAASVSVQYADAIATVTATATDPDTSASSLVLSATGLPAGLALVDNHNGTATVSGKPTVAAGTYAATVKAFDGGLTTSATLTVTVTREAATLAWNDGYFAAASTSGTATVTLKALLTQAADGSAGDLTKSKVEFRLYRTASPGSTPDSVTSNIAVSSTGAAQVTKTLGIGTWIVIVRHHANGYFEAIDSQPVVLTVAALGASRSAIGGGWVTDPSTSNTPVAISPSYPRGYFGFAGRLISGNSYGSSVYTFRGSDGLDYIVEAAEGALTFPSSGKAKFEGACSVIVLDPKTGNDVDEKAASGLSCRFDATDASTNTYSVSITRSNGSLYHRVGTSTSQLAVGSGSTVEIRSS